MPQRARTSLLEQISKLKYLNKAWQLLNTSNKSSSGLFKGSIKEYEVNINSNLKHLSTSLSSGSYKFSAVKGVALKKKIKGFRPLMISEIGDRIVHKALALKLEEKLSKKYGIKNICSFAYQKELSIQDAILKMASYYKQGYTFILEADIKSFFPSVDKEVLLKDIYSTLPDTSLNNLIKGSLNQELGNKIELQKRDLKTFNDIFLRSEEGIPQGNALSPLLANIYLSSFDKRMIKEKIKMIRYADDFIILCKSSVDANKAYVIAIEELEIKLKLKLYPLKDKANGNEKISRIVKPAEHPFSFLSVRFDGTKCSISDKKIIDIIIKLREFSSMKTLRDNYPGQEVGLLQILVKVRNALEGWIAAYSFLDIGNQITELDKHVNIILYDIFKEFGFPLKKGYTNDIRTYKKIRSNEEGINILFRNSNTRIGLNENQRRNTGVPSCIDLYNKSKPLTSFNEKIENDFNNLPTRKKRIKPTEAVPF